MTFILSTDLDFYGKRDSTIEDHKNFKLEWKKYLDYLKSLKGKIPNSAFEFANADWHYNTFDARCPHDSWLEELKFGEVLEEDKKYKLKPTDMYLKLLSAYHNGHLEIRYKNIHEFSMKSCRGFLLTEIKGSFNHNDWLNDEIRLSENGFVIHEIEWFNAHWIIECEDVDYNWIPFEENQSNDMTPKIKEEN